MMSYRTFSIITVALLLSSCVEPIVMDPLEEMPVVVNCVLTRDNWGVDYEQRPGYKTPVQRLYLYYAKRPSEKEYSFIDDASVKVIGGGRTCWFSWNGECYTSEFLPDFGTEYKLDVKLKTGEKITAQTRYPECMGIASIGVFSYAYPSPYDIRSSDAHWRYVTKATGGYNKDSHSYNYKTVICPDEAYIWITSKVDTTEILFSTSHHYSDNFNISETGVFKDLPLFDQQKAQYADIKYTKWENDRKKEYRSDPELWEKYEKVAEGLPLHPGFVRIFHPSDYDSGLRGKMFEPESDRVSSKDLFILEYGPMEPDEKRPMYYSYPVEIDFLSEEYDLYLKDIIENAYLGKDEMVNMYSMRKIYTNIKGGIGIFGAKW